MQLAHKVILAVVLLAATFLAGYWMHAPGTGIKENAVRKPLYYRDPMHPAYRSDKPGIAPDCGMQLEPVYADGSTGPGESGDSMPPGAVRVSLEKQQIMGLRVAKVTRAPESHTLRVLGRVAADETRVHRVTAQAEGVVRMVSSFTPGNLVHKDDLLATYFVPLRDVYNALQSYFVTMNLVDQRIASDPRAAGIDSAQAQVRLAEELLKTYGVSEAQLRALARTREITRDIEFRAPITGIVLSRTVGLGQRLEKNAELFRIADVSRVWVLADLFEGDSGLVRPGATARVRYRGRTLHASLGASLPPFDPASRTMKVRLELENPDLLLRPDMFVDVEFDVKEPDGIDVPVDAVLDSGLRKVVFVATGDGVYEPREVATGARYGDRVRIASGLKEGENVVVSGLFLLDSESRLQLAAANAMEPAAAPEAGADPVCGMKVDASQPVPKSEYEGATYHFCSAECKAKFDKDPARYARGTKVHK
jgi:Cu(I)/Ag(I) efflux system membrane fusion protein